MNEPVWLAVDPADESGDCTIVTALVYRITGSQQYHTFTLIDFGHSSLMRMYRSPGHAYPVQATRNRASEKVDSCGYSFLPT